MSPSSLCSTGLNRSRWNPYIQNDSSTRLDASQDRLWIVKLNWDSGPADHPQICFRSHLINNSMSENWWHIWNKREIWESRDYNAKYITVEECSRTASRYFHCRLFSHVDTHSPPPNGCMWSGDSFILLLLAIWHWQSGIGKFHIQPLPSLFHAPRVDEGSSPNGKKNFLRLLVRIFHPIPNCEKLKISTTIMQSVFHSPWISIAAARCFESVVRIAPKQARHFNGHFLQP